MGDGGDGGSLLISLLNSQAQVLRSQLDSIHQLLEAMHLEPDTPDPSRQLQELDALATRMTMMAASAREQARERAHDRGSKETGEEKVERAAARAGEPAGMAVSIVPSVSVVRKPPPPLATQDLEAPSHVEGSPAAGHASGVAGWNALSGAVGSGSPVASPIIGGTSSIAAIFSHEAGSGSVEISGLLGMFNSREEGGGGGGAAVPTTAAAAWAQTEGGTLEEEDGRRQSIEGVGDSPLFGEELGLETPRNVPTGFPQIASSRGIGRATSVVLAVGEVSSLAAPVDLERNLHPTAGAQSGVGILFHKPDGAVGPFRIANLLSGGAAETSGKIKIGDTLHAVDNTSVYPLDTQQATQLILGEPGSSVTLWIRPEGVVGGTGGGAHGDGHVRDVGQSVSGMGSSGDNISGWGYPVDDAGPIIFSALPLPSASTWAGTLPTQLLQGGMV